MEGLLEQAEEMLSKNAEWIDQSIVAMYFQSQQQSYMVNKHNKQNPETPVNIDEDGAWQEAPICKPQSNEPTLSDGVSDGEDPHEELCEYEIARRTRICQNEAMLASLCIPKLSET